MAMVRQWTNTTPLGHITDEFDAVWTDVDANTAAIAALSAGTEDIDIHDLTIATGGDIIVTDWGPSSLLDGVGAMYTDLTTAQGDITTLQEGTWQIPLHIESGYISTSSSFSSVGTNVALVCPNGSISRTYYSIGVLPDDWDGDELSIKVHWASTNTNTGTWGFRTRFQSWNAGDTLSGSTSTTVNSPTPVGTVDYVHWWRHGNRITYAAGDFVTLSIGRAASDSHTGNINILALTLENYTRLV